LTAKKYQEAKEKYQEALQYQPKEEYPKQQIAKIDDVLAQLEADAKLKRDFDQSLADGENLLKAKELAKAKDAFMKAYNLIPSEPVPPKRISEINALLAEQARKDSELKTTMEAYQAAILKADNFFGNKEYTSAQLAYKEALLIKPDEKYPVDQLALIDDQLKKQIEQNYKDAIASGDNLFNNNQLDEAATSYKEALKFKKGDQYATNKLKEIEQKKSDMEAENIRLKKLDDQYQAIISDANKDFENKVYPGSKGKYQKALALKPAESYPKDQIAKIDQILAEQQNAEETNKKYSQFIKDAETAFKQNKLKEARDLFQNGSNLKPNEPLPPTRIAEIDKILAQLDETAKLKAMEDAQRLAKEKADRQQYENEIAAGDKAFTAKEYKTARLHYTSALAVMANEKYPKDQIAKIDELLLQEEMNKSVAQRKAVQDSLMKVKNMLFDAALSMAKEHEQNNRYNQAIKKYNEAISIKPEQRPTIQKYIKEIEDRIQLLAKRDQDYQVVIKLADDYFSKSNPENALTQYKKASTIKPDEEYPKKQISLIESQLKALEENYLAAIKNGDQAFDASDWANAKTAYTSALDIKPKEQYPLNRLKEVNRKISEANLAAIKNDAENKAYKEAIEKAQNLLDQDQLTSSRTQFQVAQTLKPNEKLPAEKIAEIDALLEKRNNDRLAQAQRELDEKYRQAISVADVSYKDKSYSTSKIQYQQALLIKPEESYPKDQLALIDKILSEAKVAEKTVVKQTPKPIINPEETIQATESRAMAFQTVNDFDEAVKKADESFGIKDYSVARFYYYKASDMKPAEDYPKRQIEQIRKLIDAQLSSGDISAYNQAITQADNAFSSKNYTVAKFFYYKALGVKSWEQYPKDRINEILALTHSLLSEKEEKEYRDLIAKADEAFFGKEISIARFYYNKASAIKKDEEYPKIKLKDIKVLIEQYQIDQANQEYQRMVEAGDEALKSENYSMARFNYNKALSMKPGEKYPKDQLKLIKEALDKKSN
jgi:tetratricopeptide (TPR) repeat protein